MPSPTGNPAPRPDDPRKTLDDLIFRSIAYHSAPELKELLNFARSFPYLAPFNAMLLHIQNPGIRFALRVRQWEQKYRRRVRASARPYVILRTMGPVEFIFDLSDTEAIDPHDDRVPMAAVNPFAANGIPPIGALEKLVERCRKINVEVRTQDFGTALAGRAIRYTKRRPPYLIILNSKHTEAQQLGTLSHELAHVLCGHLGEDKENSLPERPILSKAIQEFEAEAVAYLVTDRMGLDIGSVSYLSDYLNSGMVIPKYSLDVVLKVAGKIEMLMVGGRRPKQELFMQGTIHAAGTRKNFTTESSAGGKLALAALEGLFD